MQKDTNCNSNKARTQGPIRYKRTQCLQVDALPFWKFYPETSQNANTTIEIAASATVSRALS